MEWDGNVVRSFLTYSPPSSPSAASAAAAAAAGLEALIEPLVAALAPADATALKALFATANTQVPPEHDRGLLRLGRAHYGQNTLASSEKAALRAAFVRLVQARP